MELSQLRRDPTTDQLLVMSVHCSQLTVCIQYTSALSYALIMRADHFTVLTRQANASAPVLQVEPLSQIVEIDCCFGHS